MSDKSVTRRNLLLYAAGGLGTFVLGGSRWLSSTQWFAQVLESEEVLTRHAQRWLGAVHPNAPEYTKADIDPVFRTNGTTHPDTPAYHKIASHGFRDWRLEVNGLVERPLKLSLRQIRQLPAQTQITRHDCVEGWSCIGQWTGTRLSTVLEAARPKAKAQYVMFFCADKPGLGGQTYYESLDMREAYHPQTILAYKLNGHTLPIPNGAPLRLRVPRQLGYKMAKYLMRIEVVESFSQIAGGHGGYWEDRGYSWYAGI